MEYFIHSTRVHVHTIYMWLYILIDHKFRGLFVRNVN